MRTFCSDKYSSPIYKALDFQATVNHLVHTCEIGICTCTRTRNVRNHKYKRRRQKNASVRRDKTSLCISVIFKLVIIMIIIIIIIIITTTTTTTTIIIIIKCYCSYVDLKSVNKL